MLGQKDTNLMIMEKLDDRSLLKLCLTDKNAAELCRNEPFWRRRYLSRFGERAAKHKPTNRTWKDNYLKTLVDLGRFEDNPNRFLEHIEWSGKPETSWFYPNREKPETVIPFLQSPEWVMVNFYLLDLGRGYINGKMEKHVTPEMLFDSEFKLFGSKYYINGLRYAINDFWRNPHP